MTYTFEEIQHAWEEAGIDGDWFEFVAHLGVSVTDDKAPEIFPGTLEALNKL